MPPADVAAFAPVALRVHPLTHVDLAPGQDAMVVLHLEMKDAYGDVVKGVGLLRVDLFRPGGEGEGAEPGVSWEVADMLEPAANSRRFDVATRTYRVALRAPDWVRAWCEAARAQSAGSAGGAGGPGSAVEARPLAMRVAFETVRADGTRVVLRTAAGLRP